MYALIWGRDLAHLRAPDFDVPVAPTPHPLLTLVGLVLSPFDNNAPSIFHALTLICFAAACWAAFLLGRILFSMPVGVLFAGILVTRELLVLETLYSSQDIPFLALVLWAAVLEARRRKRGGPVLVLLAAAGLIRPEAWLLSAAYLAYLIPDLVPRARLQYAALAVAAPVTWATFDFVLTGELLFSLHGTQELASSLERPRDVGTGLTAAPVYLRFILQNPVMLGGIAGCAVGLYTLYERSILPAAVAGLGLLAFLALSLADLPLLVRYLLLPAAMLGLFFAVAAFGWLNVAPGRAGRPIWIAASTIVLLLLGLSIPRDRERVSDAKAWTAVERQVQTDLRHLATAPGTKDLAARCLLPISVPGHSVVPSLAFWMDEPPAHFRSGPVAPTRGLFVAPANPRVAAAVTFDPTEREFVTTPPPTFKRMGGNRSWGLYARCS
jgi:hypothetical protein